MTAPDNIIYIVCRERSDLIYATLGDFACTHCPQVQSIRWLFSSGALLEHVLERVLSSRGSVFICVCVWRCVTALGVFTRRHMRVLICGALLCVVLRKCVAGVQTNRFGSRGDQSWPQLQRGGDDDKAGVMSQRLHGKKSDDLPAVPGLLMHPLCQP